MELFYGQWIFVRTVIFICWVIFLLERFVRFLRQAQANFERKHCVICYKGYDFMVFIFVYRITKNIISCFMSFWVFFLLYRHMLQSLVMNTCEIKLQTDAIFLSLLLARLGIFRQTPHVKGGFVRLRIILHDHQNTPQQWGWNFCIPYWIL